MSETNVILHHTKVECGKFCPRCGKPVELWATDSNGLPERCPDHDWRGGRVFPPATNLRNDMLQWTPAEKAIHDAVQAVEAAGADVLLTDAVNLLAHARQRVAMYVERVDPFGTPSPPPAPLSVPAANIDMDLRTKANVIIAEALGRVRAMGFGVVVDGPTGEGVHVKALRAVQIGPPKPPRPPGRAYA
jgi:hypothetical protein